MTSSPITTNPSRIGSTEPNSIITADLPLILSIIFSNWTAVALLTVFSTSVALAYSLLLPPVYKAEILFSQPGTSQYREFFHVVDNVVDVFL